ncbi:MAG: SDR family NAD(P)-dependent oxidoreductase [Defluviitaleaceae bacterium]|nr:SDR family NAD(P)-dependent oxidoreductase [Defluviitaleaceae bacterium]
MKFRGKRFLVTGATSGLGLAIVARLLRAGGVKVVAVGRDTSHLEKVLGDAPNVKVLSLDISKPENIEFMLDEAIRLMGGVDCVFACAGFGYHESFGRGKRPDYRHVERIFQTNVLSPIYTLEYLLAKTSHKVTFVSVSSMLGKFGLPYMSLYSATKHALAGFHSGYRFEKPKRLHLVTAYPITMKTPFWARIAPNILLPKPIQSADAAAAAILKGLKQGKAEIYTHPASKIILMFPVIIPIYQLIYRLSVLCVPYHKSVKVFANLINPAEYSVLP